jgi:hypothetical protein
MKTIFDTIVISNLDYNYFAQLDSADKLYYLFDVYEANTIKTRSIDLTEFFVDVHNSLQNSNDTYTEIAHNDHDRIDVMIDDQNILIESNNLRAVREVMNHFMESGYILARDQKLEKMFRKDKITRYLRVFTIISQVTTICLN